jgi:phosphatidylserine/phosphatidylglycerophosphate/cardiolipin synthase-like enzyme
MLNTAVLQACKSAQIGAMRGIPQLSLSVALVVALAGEAVLPVYCQPAPAAQTDLGAPHRVHTFVDVSEASPQVVADIRELGKPEHTNAQLWIAAWAWSNDFIVIPPGDRLLDEIQSAMKSNPNLKVYVLLWEIPSLANLVLDLGWAPFKDSDAMEALPEEARKRLFISRESLFSTHPLSSAHQKFMLLQYGDQSCGYCFDYNFRNFHWDCCNHDLAKHEEQGFKAPSCHDTAIRFQGSALQSFKEEFLYRWSKSDHPKDPPEAAFTTRIGSTPLPFLKARFQEPGTTGGEIKDWYRYAIQNARDYIYLENQYFDDPDIADDLIAAYFRGLSYPKPNIVCNLCSVAMLEPRSQVSGTMREVMRIRLSTAEKIEFKNGVVILRKQPWRKVRVNKLATQASISGRGFNGIIKFSAIKRLHGGVRFYSMATSEVAPRKGFSLVYVHSKVGLIDNQLTIGSANLNKRSFGEDYEANVMVTDTSRTDAVASFRKRLLEVMVAPDARGETVFQKLDATADLNIKLQLLKDPSANPVGMVIEYPYEKVRKVDPD